MGASGHRVGEPARCRRSLDFGSLAAARETGGRRAAATAISPRKRPPRQALACGRRLGDRTLRLMPSHSLTEARRHGGTENRARASPRRGGAQGRKRRKRCLAPFFLPPLFSWFSHTRRPRSFPHTLVLPPAPLLHLLPPCLRASVRDHETASRTRHRGSGRCRTPHGSLKPRFMEAEFSLHGDFVSIIRGARMPGGPSCNDRLHRVRSLRGTRS
jgi:hypothetical protein